MPGCTGLPRATTKRPPTGGASNAVRFGIHFFNLRRTAALAGLVLAVALGAAGPTAAAPSMCADRDRIVASLTTQFSERQVSVGVASNGGIVEIFASPAGTWTIIMTTPTGQSCFVASGEGWVTAPLTAQGPKA